MIDHHERAKLKAVRAFVRRHGQSVLPLDVRLYVKRGRTHVDVVDRENGAMATYDTASRRIRRVADREAIY
mgnify:FL=1